MKILLILSLLFIATSCHKEDAALKNKTVAKKAAPMPDDKVRFAYSLLGKDSLHYKYLDMSTLNVAYSDEINLGTNGTISLKKYELENESTIFFYKYNFTGTDRLTKHRDAVELYGRKFKIDSLVFGKRYYDKPYIFSSLVNIGKLHFNQHDYIAFFIQDISNPVSSPNTLILLFDVTDTIKIRYIPIGFQASEDMQCFNDFNKDGILDYAEWTTGYAFEKRLYRYELVNNEFIIKKEDFIVIDEKHDGYFIDVDSSKWKYSNFKY